MEQNCLMSGCCGSWPTGPAAAGWTWPVRAGCCASWPIWWSRAPPGGPVRYRGGPRPVAGARPKRPGRHQEICVDRDRPAS